MLRVVRPSSGVHEISHWRRHAGCAAGRARCDLLHVAGKRAFAQNLRQSQVARPRLPSPDSGDRLDHRRHGGRTRRPPGSCLPPGSRAPRRRWRRPSPVWLPVVTAVWLLGVIVLSMRMLGGWVLTRILARRAVAAVSPMVEAAAREMARRLDLQRGVAILESARGVGADAHWLGAVRSCCCRSPRCRD